MKNLGEIFLKLSANEKKRIHVMLCERSLNKWNDYVSKHKDIYYTESVCGTKQQLNMNLPREAIKSVKMGVNILSIEQKYTEPIAAMQDEDLKFPEAIMFAYYSTYNLFRKYLCSADVDDWLIVNQALSSEDNRKSAEEILSQAVIQGSNEENEKVSW